MKTELRVGHGYDVHRLISGRRLILCGVEIPSALGLLGHSDADVATHALMDALLGAAALGDIGQHFPDSNDAYKDIDSLLLLERVMKFLRLEDYVIGNVDLTIVAESPKLAPFIQTMRGNIARVCDCSLSQINVKATTEEGLGLRGEGIAAHCICLLQSVG